jgi:hypothetical protein
VQNGFDPFANLSRDYPFGNSLGCVHNPLDFQRVLATLCQWCVDQPFASGFLMPEKIYQRVVNSILPFAKGHKFAIFLTIWNFKI